MNIKFNRLNKPRVRDFKNSLVGQSVPVRTDVNSAITGLFIDEYAKNLAGVWKDNIEKVVDIMHLGIEVKSKDIHSDSNWSIGSMTFNDIIDTPYIDSPIYKKLQALFLVRYDNDLSIITHTDLYYFDNDEVQTRIQTAYESIRNEMIAFKMQHLTNLNNQLFVIGPPAYKFTSYQKFKSVPGYCFEYMNSGNSFNFRISVKEMKDLGSVSVSVNNPLFAF